MKDIADGTVRVHIDNPEDLKGDLTEEIEPQHFVCTTFSLAAATPNNPNGNTAQVLYLDTLRKNAVILSIDSAVVVCHTWRQTQDPANQVAAVPFPDGYYLPIGVPLEIDGTGPLWVVATQIATSSRVSVAINRRGSV